MEDILLSELIDVEELVPGDVVEMNGKEWMCGGGSYQKTYPPGMDYLTRPAPTLVESYRTTLSDYNGGDQIGCGKVSLSNKNKGLREKILQDWAKRPSTLHLYRRGYPSGSDPEVFVEHGDGSLFHPWEFLPDKDTNKQEYLTEIFGSTESLGYSNCPKVFWDGFQAEFCPIAGGCLEVLGDYTRFGLMRVLQLARQKDSKAKLSIKSAWKIGKQEMKKVSKEHAQFRCSTSMNIYGDVGETPDSREYLWRFAGGHVHIGCGKKPGPVVKEIIRGLDGVLGVAAVSMAANHDVPERRRMYGRAGEFRLPGHGIEYRVLSNYWLCDPLIYHLTFELARLATSFAEQGLFRHVWQGEEQEIRDIINWCDVDGARKLIERNLGGYSWLLGRVFRDSGNPKIIPTMLRVIQGGSEEVVKDPSDIEGNWNLGGEWKCYGRLENKQWKYLSL